jgi:hypothetical protein
MSALAFIRVISGFDDTIGHTYADNIQSVPKTTVKYEVAHIPNPFKTDIRKHKNSPSSIPSTILFGLNRLVWNYRY